MDSKVRTARCLFGHHNRHGLAHPQHPPLSAV